MSKKWSDMYPANSSIWRKIRPHLAFNAGRLISYLLLGGLIGAIGSKLQISLSFTSILIIAVSVLMFILALQMLGLKTFQRIRFSIPKFTVKKIIGRNQFQKKNMPFIMGAFTFFLPCGFTITAQGLALISGSAAQGALIMFVFALGTLPPLLLIGFSALKFLRQPRLADRFLKTAGVVVLFFALFNFNTQLNVLGFYSIGDLLRLSGKDSLDENLAPIVGGKQILKMDALAYAYSPNYFKVKAGVPVRWEIEDKGISGCTNAIIARGLFSGEIPLASGRTSVKEFIPDKPGVYKFSCWMGMVLGTIEVVDGRSSATSVLPAASDEVDYGDLIPLSGASGSACACGCGSR